MRCFGCTRRSPGCSHAADTGVYTKYFRTDSSGARKGAMLAVSHAYWVAWSQKRFYTVDRGNICKYRNVVENTLADTPSGYIQDPANFPKQMVAYNKVTPEVQATLDEMERQDELMNNRELTYKGYTTVAIQESKAIIFKNSSTQEEIELACRTLSQSLEELLQLVGCKVKKTIFEADSLFIGENQGDIGKTRDDHIINFDDINHVRYIIALGTRRLGNYQCSQRMCMDILSTDHGNCDAMECLLEIYTGTGSPEKIRELFDQLVKWRDEDIKVKVSNGWAAVPDGGARCEGGKLDLVEIGLVLLSDIVVEAASLHYLEHGEGTTSRFFHEVVSSITRALGMQFAPLFLGSLFSCLDEQHLASRLRGTQVHESEHTVGLVISFLKMLIATKTYKLVDDATKFEFQILSKLHAALHFVGRKHESYGICERLIKLFRSNSLKYRSYEHGKAESLTGLLDDFEPEYKLALFQYVEDRALDSLDVGKRLCIKAIEEYPNESRPWETLALILHKERPIEGLSDAVIAAKRAFFLDPSNIQIVLTLANFYKAQKRYNLYHTMIDRYKLLKHLTESGAHEDEIKIVLGEINVLEEEVPCDKEADDVSVQFADIRAHMEKMEVAHTYSMPIDKEPRVFRDQPLTVPILDPFINTDKPSRKKDIGE
uniref:Uncharacterized protein n=1 Tax=Trypanosoma congolense (strain IL3000) TaxID=1068625 RepID=G0URM2_TRYCI|nr:conserved hypothetical protein [Trypanosoma congolense IL3000]